MKIDIILAGVGGQGILSIANIIDYASLESNLYLKQAEVHGMSQRGGDVQSHLRVSDKPISSDLIPRGECDIILSVEPMESLRYLPYLSKDGKLITNSVPFINIPNYPEKDVLSKEIEAMENAIIFNANDLAKKAGNLRAVNMVMLGAISNFIDISEEKLKEGIEKVFASKGEKIVNINLDAFEAGKKAANA